MPSWWTARGPRPGASPPEVTLGEAAARTLHAKVGDVLPIADRRTERVERVVIRGIWRQRDAAEPYWLLSPEAADGVAPGSHTYGPIVLSRDDFLRGYADGASLGWVVQPDLGGAGLAELTTLRDDLAARAATLPERSGLGTSAQVTTRLDRLVGRLVRADLVGRSALLTPMLLIAVIGGYALLLVALLLTEHRRTETALMRARGAGRWQLAGLAAREAALVVAARRAARPAGRPMAAAGRAGHAAAARRRPGRSRRDGHPALGGRRRGGRRLPARHGRARRPGGPAPTWRSWAAGRARVAGRRRSGPARTSPWSPSPSWPGCNCASTRHRCPAPAAGSASTRSWPPRPPSACWPARSSRCACSRR